MFRPNGYSPSTIYIPDHEYQSPYVIDWRNPDYNSIILKRQERLNKIREDDMWPVVKRYYADGNSCAFIEDWLFTFDPRRSPAHMPLILFPRQIEYVEALDRCYDHCDEYGENIGRDLIVAKSRDMGVSVITLAWFTYKWLFDEGFKGSVGSRKEDLVDKIGSQDSLLEKVRMFLRTLPHELLPAKYSERNDARRLNIVNPQTGASITGEAGNNIGRGGRSSAYLVDEAAFLENPEAVDAALSQNCKIRIDISTPNGPDGPFADKWFHNGEVEAFAFHWTQRPDRNADWYEKEKRRLNDPRIIAQELDLDFKTSGEESVIRPEWIQASTDLRRYLLDRDEFPDRSKFETVAGCDVGGGVAENTFITVSGPVVGNMVAWIDDDTTKTAQKFTRLAQQERARLIKFDSIGVGKGVESTLKRLPVPSKGVNVGSSPTKTVWPDGKKSKDRFVNLKAEAWWTLRDRLLKTFEHWKWICDPGQGREHKLEDLILLPDDRELLQQLSAPGYKATSSGKIQIEGKAELKRRGIRSPDRAEALIVALAPHNTAKYGVRRVRGLTL